MCLFACEARWIIFLREKGEQVPKKVGMTPIMWNEIE